MRAASHGDTSRVVAPSHDCYHRSVGRDPDSPQTAGSADLSDQHMRARDEQARSTHPKSRMPRLLAWVLVVGLVLVGAAPAAPPDSPTRFITAISLKALLDGGTQVEIIDVRKREE